MTESELRTPAASGPHQLNAQPRVLIVIAGGLRDPGGVTRCMENLIESWRQSPSPPEYRIIDPRGVGSIWASPWYFAKALASVLCATRYAGPVVVHANMCEYGSTLRKLPIVLLASRLGQRTLIHLHGAEIKTMFARLPPWLRPLFRWGVSQADRVVVLGKSWQTFLRGEVGIPAQKVLIVPNAVAIPPCADRGSAHAPCRLLFVGRLEERKGADRLLQALASPSVRSLPWQAVMAGDGQIETYRRMASTLGLADRVTFTGWLSREAVAEHMRTADVLVLPSLNEGLPMAILEAMAHGLAVVTTPVGAIPDVIHDGETGLLVPPGDVPRLSATLRTILTDRELRERLGFRARAVAQADFDMAQFGERFLHIYQEMLCDGRRQGRDVQATRT